MDQTIDTAEQMAVDAYWDGHRDATASATGRIQFLETKLGQVLAERDQLKRKLAEATGQRLTEVLLN